MPRRKRSSAKYSVLLGFKPGDLESRPAFLKFGDGGYEFSDEMSAAALFERFDCGRSGWAAPSAWAEFFSQEPELSGWKFREVPTLRVPAGRQEER